MNTYRVINKSHGITTGIGITQYFITLFEANEFLPLKQRMTDDSIASKIAREFPDRKSAQDFMNNKAKKTVNSYRYRYNSGKFTKGVPPSILSLRYNQEGTPVNLKTGTTILSSKQIDLFREEHKKFREKTLRNML